MKKFLITFKKNKKKYREKINNQEKRNLKEKENIINEINQLTEQKELLKIHNEIKDKKVLQKIILCDVQKEIYPELEKALLNLLHTSGYPNIKFEKKVDFDELYNKQFN